MLIRIPVCVAFAAMLSGCGSSAEGPTSPVGCSTAITIGIFSNGSPASPGQGMAWTSYFQATVLPAQPSVYVTDINSAPAGCLTTWMAVSANHVRGPTVAGERHRPQSGRAIHAGEYRRTAVHARYHRGTDGIDCAGGAITPRKSLRRRVPRPAALDSIE
jgi:hypothetical protein